MRALGALSLIAWPFLSNYSETDIDGKPRADLPHLHKYPVGLRPRSELIRSKQWTHQSQTAETHQHKAAPVKFKVIIYSMTFPVDCSSAQSIT